jgi:hypothetical protein
MQGDIYHPVTASGLKILYQSLLDCGASHSQAVSAVGTGCKLQLSFSVWGRLLKCSSQRILQLNTQLQAGVERVILLSAGGIVTVH